METLTLSLLKLGGGYVLGAVLLYLYLQALATIKDLTKALMELSTASIKSQIEVAETLRRVERRVDDER